MYFQCIYFIFYKIFYQQSAGFKVNIIVIIIIIITIKIIAYTSIAQNILVIKIYKNSFLPPNNANISLVIIQNNTGYAFADMPLIHVTMLSTQMLVNMVGGGESFSVKRKELPFACDILNLKTILRMVLVTSGQYLINIESKCSPNIVIVNIILFNIVMINVVKSSLIL